MAYQVLARKWRPSNFREMAGQAHVLQTLTHALEQQRLHHAYLFTGTRGVGKTTVARILARCLNCEQGITATPCGQCSACREISEGRFIDLIEVDAASRTRVEDTRELLDNVQYAPTRGRFKVYLIDEVHMLSTHSFNALLKTLEEPPPHVKFLLATTDPQKLPVTVLSRCLQFHLKNLAPQQIVTYLQSVLTAEQIDFEEDALWHLGRAAAGSMRDALTLLDQAIAFGQGQVRSAAVSALLGTPDTRLIIDLLAALARRDGAGMLQRVADAAEQNPDFERLMSHIMATLHRIALAQTVPDAVDNSEGDREQVLALAEQMAAEDVQLYYQFALQTLTEMKHVAQRRVSFEMGLLRMLAFSPDVFAGDTLMARSTDTLSIDEKKKPEPRSVAGDTRSIAADNTPPPGFSADPLAINAQSVADQSADDMTLNPEPEPEPVSISEPAHESEPVPEPESRPHNISDDTLPGARSVADTDDWYDLVKRCGLNGISGNILWNCVPVSRSDNEMQLLLDETQSALFTPDYVPRIAEALSDTLGRPLQVQIQIGTIAAESPAQRRQREKQEAEEALRQRFRNDPGVIAIIETFDATIEELR